MSRRRRLSRRWILAASGAAASTTIAGCSFVSGTSKGATDVVVHNETVGTIAVSIAITGANDEPRLNRTIRIESLERTTPTASDKLPVGTDYTVEVDVVDGPAETFRWRDVRLELAPLHVIVDGSDNVLFALQAG